MHEHPSERDSLPLPARQRAERLFGKGTETEPVRNSSESRRRVNPVEARRKLYIFPRGHVPVRPRLVREPPELRANAMPELSERCVNDGPPARLEPRGNNGE